MHFLWKGSFKDSCKIVGLGGFGAADSSISPFWSSSAVTGIPASPQRVVREEEQSANNPRITANSATFSRCTQYRIDDFVGWLVRSTELNLRREGLHPIGKFMPQGAAQLEAL
jgi:hypothetical protein